MVKPLPFLSNTMIRSHSKLRLSQFSHREMNVPVAARRRAALNANVTPACTDKSSQARCDLSSTTGEAHINEAHYTGAPLDVWRRPRFPSLLTRSAVAGSVLVAQTVGGRSRRVTPNNHCSYRGNPDDTTPDRNKNKCNKHLTYNPR